MYSYPPSRTTTLHAPSVPQVPPPTTTQALSVPQLPLPTTTQVPPPTTPQAKMPINRPSAPLPNFSVLDNLSFLNLLIPSPAWYNTSSPATHLNYPAKHHPHCPPIATQFHSQQNHLPPATLCDTDTLAEILPTSLDSPNSPIAPNTQPAPTPHTTDSVYLSHCLSDSACIN